MINCVKCAKKEPQSLVKNFGVCCVIEHMLIRLMLA